MCFYRDNSVSFKSNLKLKAPVKPIQVQMPENKQVQTAKALNDHYAIKKHELDKVVPGLFDELFKLGNVSGQTIAPLQQTHVEENRSSVEERMARSVGDLYNQTPTHDAPRGQNFMMNGFNSQLSSLMLMSNQIQMDQVLRENIFKMLTANTILLNQLSEDIDKNATKVIACFERTTSLRSEIKGSKATPEQPKNAISKIQETPINAKTTNYNPNPMQLFQHLCGDYSRYPYELVLENEVPNPIFRERNIKLKVGLVNAIDKKPALDHSKVVLQITLHTWQIPSNIITRNKIGNRVIQGEVECELRNGEAVFDKLQINEVTSKFINGYVAILISPKRPNNYGTSLDVLEKEKESMTCDDIKPLMIEKVVVKSKKKKYIMKKKKSEKKL